MLAHIIVNGDTLDVHTPRDELSTLTPSYLSEVILWIPEINCERHAMPPLECKPLEC
jgi:hypothetical protein